MASELRPVIRLLGLARAPAGPPDLFVGSTGSVELVATRTGIGMRAAARCTEALLAQASPDWVVVVGIAGGIGPEVGIGDLIVPASVRNLETGDTLRPAPLAGPVPRGVLGSRDRLLESPSEARSLQEMGLVAIDMETAAVAGVCDARGCRWSVFRAISDRADDGTTDAAVFGLAAPDGTPDLAAVARFVLRRPARIPQLVRLARGAAIAARVAAEAAAGAIRSL